MAEVNTNLIVTIASTLVGTALGATGGYLFAKKKLAAHYANLADQEVEEVKQTLAKRYKEGGFETPADAAKTLNVEVIEEVVIEVDEDQAEFEQLIIDNQYVETVEAEEIVTVTNPDEPYIIAHDEWIEGHDEHDKTVLYYYEGDDILAGEDGMTIEDTDTTVGPDALVSFGQRSKDHKIVYIRNERLAVDFEIHKDERTYTEAVLGYVGDENRVFKMKADD